MKYPIDAPHTDAMVETRLVYAVSAIMLKAFDRALASWGLSVQQAPVLINLREAGRPLIITELARHLLLKNPSVSTMVERLKERGLVERVKHPEDRRKTFVALTRKGQRLAETIVKPGHQLQEEMFGALEPGERETLKTILQKFCDANIGLIE